MCHINEKKEQNKTKKSDSNSNEAVIDKITNFYENAPKFTYAQKSYSVWLEIDRAIIGRFTDPFSRSFSPQPGLCFQANPSYYY